jgi:hypothetical protein
MYQRLFVTCTFIASSNRWNWSLCLPRVSVNFNCIVCILLKYILSQFSERFSTRNAALLQNVRSSSIFPHVKDDQYTANWAVDGKTAPSVQQCFHSKLETSPWIQVDLGRSYMISFVRLYNRMDQAGLKKIAYMLLCALLENFSHIYKCYEFYMTWRGENCHLFTYT